MFRRDQPSLFVIDGAVRAEHALFSRPIAAWMAREEG